MGGKWYGEVEECASAHWILLILIYILFECWKNGGTVCLNFRVHYTTRNYKLRVWGVTYHSNFKLSSRIENTIFYLEKMVEYSLKSL